MPTFDRTIEVTGTPSRVAEVIQASVNVNHRLVIPRPDKVLITLRPGWGYVYLLQPQGNVSTNLRLIVASTKDIRSAFRFHDLTDALIALLETTERQDDDVQRDAEQELTTLKLRIESGGPGTEPAPLAPTSGRPMPTSSLATLKPWNPDSFAFLYLFNTIFIGIAFALNWRRLRKRAWVLPTIGLSILPPGIAFPVLMIETTFEPARLLKMAIFILALASGWGLALGLGSLQRGAYKHWQQGGDLTRYDYNFDRAALIGGLVTVGFTVGVGAFTYFSTRPTVYETAGLKVTYPSVWAPQDMASLPECQTPAQVECLLGVADERFGYTWVSIFRYPGSTGLTAEQTAAYAHRYLASQGGQIVGTDTLQVDGILAERFFYTLPVEGDRHYGMQIFLSKGGYTYEVIAESLNQGIFQEREADINELIAGIDFQ
jgi:hypothetical protein